MIILNMQTNIFIIIETAEKSNKDVHNMLKKDVKRVILDV